MSGYPHLATRLYNSPLMILPAKGEVIEHVFRGYVESAVVPVSAEEQEAFERLRRASQLAGRPLKVVAEALIATFEP